MNAADNPYSLAVPLGRFLGTRLKVSALMLVAELAVVWRVKEVTISLMFGAVLFLSVCLSEMARLSLGHRMKLRCSERVLWPFGGLFGEYPATTNPLIHVAGPCVNFVLAGLAAILLDSRNEMLTLLNPSTCWDGLATDNIVILMLRMGFLVNIVITLANIFPVRPMSGGYVLQSLFSRKYSAIEVRDLLLRSGLVLSIFGLLAGFVFDLSGLAALSAFLLLLHVQEAVQWFQPHEAPHPSYKSGEFDSRSYPRGNLRDEAYVDDREEADDDVPDSVIDRWKIRRDSERDLRKRELEQREHDELDRVLEKLHTMGRDALSIAELHLLNRVSARLRQKNH